MNQDNNGVPRNRGNEGQGTMRNLPEAIDNLRARTVKLLTKNGQINEQETKSALVTPMLLALGWDCEDPDEVRWEYRYTSRDNPVDYALCVAGRPRLFVEAKALGRDLGQHNWRTAAVNYANTAGVDWCVLTDGNFWQVYKSNAPGDLDAKLFLETWLHSPRGLKPPYEPVYVLSLLSRQKLADNEIEVLWRLLNVDRRGAQVLTDLVRGKDAGLVRLIQTHSGLAKADVLAFLDRARVTVDTSVSPPPPPPPPPPPEPGGDEEARARGPYKTVTESLAQADQHLRERCEALRDFLRGLGDDVQEETRKYYFAFKRTQNFACVEIRLRPPALVVYVKVSPESVDLEPGFTRDVRHIGHYGTGDLEITINSDDDLEHAKPLLIRSYESS